MAFTPRSITVDDGKMGFERRLATEFGIDLGTVRSSHTNIKVSEASLQVRYQRPTTKET